MGNNYLITILGNQVGGGYTTFFFFFFGCAHMHCCTWAFSSCGEQRLLSSCGVQASHCSGFSCVQVSPCALGCGVLSSFGERPQLSRAMWDSPHVGSGIKGATPALAGGFLAIGPPGKPHNIVNVQSISEFFSLKGLILRYVNFTSIENKKKSITKWTI